MVLVGMALIGGLVLLVTGGDNNESGSSTSQRVKDLQDKFLKHTVVNRRDGISVRRPGDWKDAKEHGVISLQSADRCVAVHLSVAGEAKQAKSLRTDAVKAFRSAYKNVRVGPGGHAEVGGIPTTSNTISLTDDKGNRRSVLFSIGKGKKNAYVTEVVLGNPSCRADLQLAQLVLTSVEYTK